ncbi:MAG: DUF3105 domain-containing protein [Chloroflexi bacterium]|nr:DUF3105 domain-containing protein [Chloroflexota bacterium]
MSKKHPDPKNRRREKPRQRRKRWNRSYSILAIVVAVITIGGLVAFAASRNGVPESEPGAFVPSLGNQHIRDATAAGIQYNSDPPTSGPHYGEGLARWGVYSEPVQKGLMIHNLEDGGVVVSYDPKAPKDTVDGLAQIVGRYRDHVLMAPYPGLDTAIALTAWTRILKLDAVDEAKIVAFIDAYKGIDHHVRRP